MSRGQAVNAVSCALAVAVALFAAGCGGGSTQSTTPITASTTSATDSASSNQVAATTASTVAQQPPPKARPVNPLDVVQRYWRAISARQFGAAYAYLDSGAVPQSESQFAADEQQAGIQTVTFQGQAPAVSGSTATVQVESLTTDDSQYGCRSWTGSYQLISSAGKWLISRANITPSPCAPSETTPTAAAPPSPSTTDGSSSEVEVAGSYSHADDAGFCSTNQCIANFPNGNGYIVQCADGEWSHSGGLSGACSDHGGEG